MLRKAFISTVAAALGLGLAGVAQATTITSFYGDDDGFGVGETAGSMTSSTTSNAAAGEAPFTDIRLIGDSCCFAAPAFAPTGSFGAFALDGPIVSAMLTMRTGAFDSGPSPVDGANLIMLDGLALAASFINGFTTADSEIIETQSVLLDPAFFALLADGLVSLSGTHISEDGGSRSFQIDFMRLVIETAAGDIPEPGTLALLGVALAGLGLLRRRRRSV